MPRSEATAIFEQIKNIGESILAHIDFIGGTIVTLAYSLSANVRQRALLSFVTILGCVQSPEQGLSIYRKLAIKIDPKLFVECMGSYRR